MSKYTVMSYNIENMRQLFHKNLVREECADRAKCIAETIAAAAPAIVGVVEASDRLKDHENFIDTTTLSDLGYKIAFNDDHSAKRGKQNLAFYYQADFEVVGIDENIDFYDSWIEDIDEDGIKEVCEFERRPLEVEFRHIESGTELLIILASFKSKGVFSVTDLHIYEHLALANRKRLLAQGKKVRQRLDELLIVDPSTSVIVMGDLNDEPGMDHFERQVGASAVETVTGNIHARRGFCTILSGT